MSSLVAIHTYPVKACGASGHDERRVEARGLEGDRRWMVVGEAGRFLTQRELPRLGLVRPTCTASGVRLAAPGMPVCDGELEQAAERFAVRVWDDALEARPAVRAAAEWLTRFLGTPARLVHMDADCVRPARSGADHELSFADAEPLLVTTEASLAELRRRVGEELEMARFRPNLVVGGTRPFEEDGWRRIRIGAVELEVVGPCERCSVTTLDPKTLEAHPRGEPLRTLARFRRGDGGGVLFGVYARALAPGELRVGDALVVHDDAAG